jgi:hypothetical protein
MLMTPWHIGSLKVAHGVVCDGQNLIGNVGKMAGDLLTVKFKQR